MLKKKKLLSYLVVIIGVLICFLFTFQVRAENNQKEKSFEEFALETSKMIADNWSEEEVHTMSVNPYETCRIIVKAKQLLDTNDAKGVVSGYNDLYILQYDTPKQAEDACKQYKKMKDVEWAEPDSLVHTTEANENDAIYSKEHLSWGYGQDYVDLDEYLSWLLQNKGSINQLSEVEVAVVDTGVDYNHEFLKDRIVSHGYDYINNDNMAMDDNHHGTHVAGTIVDGTLNNVKVLPVKVLDGNGEGPDSSIYLGICYAIEQGVDVINLSLGGAGTSSILEEGINKAVSKGICVCVAAGNENVDAKGVTPANVESAITVAAIDEEYHKAAYSNYGEIIDIAAPGNNIYSSVPQNYNIKGYVKSNGTSMAAPHVSAAAACLKSYNKKLSVSQIEMYLKNNVKPVKDFAIGEGLICMNNILQITNSCLKLSSYSQTLYMGVYDNIQINAEIIPADKKVSWSSDNPQIVQVDNGKLIAIGEGQATVTASIVDDYGEEISKKCQVNVYKIGNWYKENENLLYISTARELYELSLLMPYDGFKEKTIKLKKDIDLSSYTNWKQIGTKEIVFQGKIDGGGFTVSNLTITDKQTDACGLFYSIGENAVITSLNLKNSLIQGQNDTGAICSINYGTIENCEIEGKIIGKNNTGGVCGINNNLIQKCQIKGSIVGESNIGGICGYHKKNIINCVNYAEIKAENNIGGICGYMDNYTTIINCTNNGKMQMTNILYSDEKVVGGITGYTGILSKINNCLNTGEINIQKSNSGQDISVKLGNISGKILYSSVVDHCVALKELSANSNIEGIQIVKGMIVGENYNASIKNCYCQENEVLGDLLLKLNDDVYEYNKKAEINKRYNYWVEDSNHLLITNYTHIETAKKPEILTQPINASYQEGEKIKKISIKAKTLDGGTLSYNWYQAKTNKQYDGKKVGEGKEYTPTDLKKEGTIAYYYCKISNHNPYADAQDSLTYSKIITIKISGHGKVSDWIIDKKPTYKNDGSKHTECTICHKTLKTAKIPHLKLKMPGGITLTNTAAGITVKWNKVTGAEGYFIYRKVGNAKTWKSIKKISKASINMWTDNSVKNGTKYSYSVKAYAGANTSSYNQTGKIGYYLKCTSITKMQKSTLKLIIQWKKNTKANGYQIEYVVNNQVKKLNIASNKIIKATIKSKKGITYEIKIRSYHIVSGKKYYSAWSKKKKVKIC